MSFDVYVYNNPHNAWTYTNGYIQAFQALGLLGRSGDITSWHNQANWENLFETPSTHIVMIGVEHHRFNIFGDVGRTNHFCSIKGKHGKKIIGITYESMSDPFGQAGWARAGYKWLSENYGKYGSRSIQCYTTDQLDKQFRCLDYAFVQDEIDELWLRHRGINAHWLPACIDADVFRPIVDKPEHAAAFIGNLWWPRDELHARYPFFFHRLTVPKANFNAGTIRTTIEGLVWAFSKYLVGVNMRSPFAGISMRTFEIMACGRMPIIFEPAPDRTKNKALLAGFPHAMWFNEFSPESTHTIKSHHTHVMAYPDETLRRGLACREFILQAHTPTHRIRTIQSIIK